MSHSISFRLDLGEETETYFKLLSEEDFDFRTKDINIQTNRVSSETIELSITCQSIIDLKIANSALIKSLEVIEKTLEV